MWRINPYEKLVLKKFEVIHKKKFLNNGNQGNLKFSFKKRAYNLLTKESSYKRLRAVIEEGGGLIGPIT